MISVAVANHKGGVGKTTTAVNLAACLARQGWRTLLVDVDAQAHATFWFVEDPAEVAADLHDVVAAGVGTAAAIRPTRIEGLDLLPATLALARLELDLVSMLRREDRIARALEQVAGDYDVAVLDLAPSLSLLTLAALSAAQAIITPVSATRLAVSGLGAFLGWTDDLREAGAVTAPLLGVVITMVEARTRISREIVEQLRESDLPIFGATIPRRTAAEDHVGAGVVAGDPGANEDLSTAYSALADEVIAALRPLGLGARGPRG